MCSHWPYYKTKYVHPRTNRWGWNTCRGVGTTWLAIPNHMNHAGSSKKVNQWAWIKKSKQKQTERCLRVLTINHSRNPRAPVGWVRPTLWKSRTPGSYGVPLARPSWAWHPHRDGRSNRFQLKSWKRFAILPSWRIRIQEGRWSPMAPRPSPLPGRSPRASEKT